MSKKDYYETLGVSKTATSTEIKKAYRKLAKQYHPDKNPGDKKAEEQFKLCSEAYEVLSNDEKKANYDRFGHDSGPRIRQSPSYHSKQVKFGESLTLLVKITLEEIYSGVNKRYRYLHNTKCTDCDGNGGTGVHDCRDCGGSGMVLQGINTPFGQFTHLIECNSCNGIGTKYTTECNTCKGDGILSTEETVNVDIPSGVQNGSTFVMEGKGHAIKGGHSGNLNINIIELPHAKYIRNGYDLKLKLPLDYTQLILGDKVEIETIDGGRIRVSVPEYSNVGHDLRVPNKGLKHFKGQNRGDIVITLGIDIPKNINDKTKDLLIQLKESFGEKKVETK